MKTLKIISFLKGTETVYIVDNDRINHFCHDSLSMAHGTVEYPEAMELLYNELGITRKEYAGREYISTKMTYSQWKGRWAVVCGDKYLHPQNVLFICSKSRGHRGRHGCVNKKSGKFGWRNKK